MTTTATRPPLTREALFTRLYLDCFPAVARFVRQSGGSLDEARDVFQEALLAYYEKTRQPEFQPKRSAEAYLLGITRNLFRKMKNKALPTTALENIELEEEESAVPMTGKLMRYLQTAGKKCMDMLTAFYYEKLPMREMADRFGFGSERSATVQKYKCLEKVRQTITEKSASYEDFLD